MSFLGQRGKQNGIGWSGEKFNREKNRGPKKKKRAVQGFGAKTHPVIVPTQKNEGRLYSG